MAFSPNTVARAAAPTEGSFNKASSNAVAKRQRGWRAARDGNSAGAVLQRSAGSSVEHDSLWLFFVLDWARQHNSSALGVGKRPHADAKVDRRLPQDPQASLPVARGVEKKSSLANNSVALQPAPLQAVGLVAASLKTETNRTASGTKLDGADEFHLLLIVLTALVLLAFLAVCRYSEVAELDELVNAFTSSGKLQASGTSHGIDTGTLAGISPPVLHRKYLQPTREFPLLVPLEAMVNAVEADYDWSVSIRGKSGVEMLLARSGQSQGRKVVQLLTESGTLLGHVDPSLQVRTIDGAPFGTLEPGMAGEYGLKEASHPRPRMLFVPKRDRDELGLSFDVVWAPDGRVLSSLTRVTGSRFGHAQVLQVGTTPGTDAILVLLCVLGLIVYRIVEPGKKAAPEEEEETAERG